ncbi:aldo/keto reductase [candidate division KSB1 bacterium]|nr:aldo/keto reductase [candidate division KSB1 bacterium]
MKNITRRNFMKSAAVVTGFSVTAACTKSSKTFIKKTAADRVPLGKTGLTLSRLGIGAGTNGGNVQRGLGNDGFNRLIRYAYERGITYIDTADAYRTHTWIREAIQGLPREKLFIQSKIGGKPEQPMDVLDRFRQELNTDYIDSVLIHAKINGDWTETNKPLMEALQEAKQKGWIRAYGISCHSLPALKVAAASDWVEVNLVRFNPQGVKMDTPNEVFFDDSNTSHIPPVLEQMAMMRENGHGIIGMKLIGNGDFTDPKDREKSIRFAMQPGLVDAVTIGFKSEAEIDEAINNINTALADQV